MGGVLSEEALSGGQFGNILLPERRDDFFWHEAKLGLFATCPYVL
jgi:hypothetical protein